MRTAGDARHKRKFLGALLLLIFAGCSAAGAPDSPSGQAAGTPSPPAPAGVLWRTDTALFRSQTDGSATTVLEDAPGFDPFGITVTGSTVVYHVIAPPDPALANFGLEDIWQVQTNGTGKRAVVTTADAEIVRGVFGPWVVYERAVYANNAYVSSTMRGVRLDNATQTLITSENALYRLHVGDRAIFERIEQGNGGSVFSVLVDGTDVRTIADIPPGSPPATFLTPIEAIGDIVVMNKTLSQQNIQNLIAVPVTGGSVISLTQDSDYDFIGAVVGQRIVYHRCPLVPNPDPQDTRPVAGPCDVYSVLVDGSGTVPLATSPESEHVQGAIGSQVVIRRSGGSVDTLYSLPVTGGSETPILALSADEFVSWFVQDRMIIKRQNGLWSVKADGSGLIQLTTDSSDSSNQAAGSFICFQRGPVNEPDLWCVPADGTGPATHVAKGAYFVSGL
ncbi:MAG TPA: hypothetical protein VFS39_02820 [Nitrospira sp.]|nr:hypothetical protein [Nitrospira sp.]